MPSLVVTPLVIGLPKSESLQSDSLVMWTF